MYASIKPRSNKISDNVKAYQGLFSDNRIIRQLSNLHLNKWHIEFMTGEFIHLYKDDTSYLINFSSQYGFYISKNSTCNFRYFGMMHLAHVLDEINYNQYFL